MNLYYGTLWTTIIDTYEVLWMLWSIMDHFRLPLCTAMESYGVSYHNILNITFFKCTIHNELYANPLSQQ